MRLHTPPLRRTPNMCPDLVYMYTYIRLVSSRLVSSVVSSHLIVAYCARRARMNRAEDRMMGTRKYVDDSSIIWMQFAQIRPVPHDMTPQPGF